MFQRGRLHLTLTCNLYGSQTFRQQLGNCSYGPFQRGNESLILSPAFSALDPVYSWERQRSCGTCECNPIGYHSQALTGAHPVGGSWESWGDRNGYKLLPGRYWWFVVDSSKVAEVVLSGFPGHQRRLPSNPSCVLN